jgi:hypothetical protein
MNALRAAPLFCCPPSGARDHPISKESRANPRTSDRVFEPNRIDVTVGFAISRRQKADGQYLTTIMMGNDCVSGFVQTKVRRIMTPISELLADAG